MAGGAPALSVIGQIIGAVSGLASIGSSLGVFGGKKEGGGGSFAPQAPPVPTGPATQPDKESFVKPSPMNSPAALNISGGLSPLQMRTAIATGGVSGDMGKYRTPEAKDYYKNLAFQEFVGPEGGAVGEPTGVEKQYLQEGFGVTPRSSTTASFLSALERG